MKQVNEQIQHERKILQEIYCLIQCDVSDVIYLDIDGQHVVVNFEGENCYVSDSLVSMIIEVDYQDKVLRNVTIEK